MLLPDHFHNFFRASVDEVHLLLCGKSIYYDAVTIQYILVAPPILMKGSSVTEEVKSNIPLHDYLFN